MDQPTSESLLQRLREQDPVAWQRASALYRPLLHYWCHQGGVPDSAVEDVIQEVFQAVAANLPQYDPARCGFRGWMRGICRHKIADYFRRREPRADGGSTARRVLEQLPAAETPGDPEVETTEKRLLLMRALDLVRGEFEPQTYRAFWRTVVDQLPARAAGEELQMTPSAVRVAKCRVLRRLREECQLEG